MMFIHVKELASDFNFMRLMKKCFGLPEYFVKMADHEEQ